MEDKKANPRCSIYPNRQNPGPSRIKLPTDRKQFTDASFACVRNHVELGKQRGRVQSC